LHHAAYEDKHWLWKESTQKQSVTEMRRHQDRLAKVSFDFKKNHCWVPVAHACILATQEAETRRIMVRSQPGEIVRKTLSRKILSQKIWAGGVAQGVGPSSKAFQYAKKIIISSN
jgi:hypothetical protein